MPAFLFCFAHLTGGGRATKNPALRGVRRATAKPVMRLRRYGIRHAKKASPFGRGGGRLRPPGEKPTERGPRGIPPAGDNAHPPRSPLPKEGGMRPESARGVCCPTPSGRWQWGGAQNYTELSGF